MTLRYHPVDSGIEHDTTSESDVLLRRLPSHSTPSGAAAVPPPKYEPLSWENDHDPLEVAQITQKSSAAESECEGPYVRALAAMVINSAQTSTAARQVMTTDPALECDIEDLRLRHYRNEYISARLWYFFPLLGLLSVFHLFSNRFMLAHSLPETWSTLQLNYSAMNFDFAIIQMTLLFLPLFVYMMGIYISDLRCHFGPVVDVCLLATILSIVLRWSLSAVNGFLADKTHEEAVAYVYQKLNLVTSEGSS